MFRGAHIMTQPGSPPRKQVVALFNASDDTVEMVQRMLDAAGFTCLIGCRFSDVRKGIVDFARYISEHQPEVVILRHIPTVQGELAVLQNAARRRGDGGDRPRRDDDQQEPS